LDTTELLKKVRKIEIKTRGLSRHLFAGGYHSTFKGRGMSFSEVRSYQFGDDVRNIDWNVTARTGEPHIKVFEEERELTVMFLVDISKSSFFGTSQQFKSEILTEICATLAFSAIQNNDKVGILLFSDRTELYIPPKKGRQHILRIIRELVHTQPQGTGTDLGESLQHINNALKKRSVCFVLSDFLTNNYETPLRIAGSKHDLIGIHLYDPREKDLPAVGLLHVEDAETGTQQWIDTNNKAAQKAYNQYFESNLAKTKSAFLKSGADFLSISTVESYTNALLRFFENR
jgi:uncharacterized protein (DUF58 family)